MKKKYLQKDIYPQNGGKNYWWSKINGKKLNEENYRWSKINISYNNATSKNNKLVRQYTKSINSI